MMPKQDSHTTRRPDDQDAWVSIESAVNSLQYGVVTVVIHEGRIMQVEKCEKYRFRLVGPPSNRQTVPGPDDLAQSSGCHGSIKSDD